MEIHSLIQTLRHPFHFPAVRVIDAQNLGRCMRTEDTGRWDLTGTKNPACPVTHFVASPAYNCEGLTDWVAACSKLEHFQVVTGALLLYGIMAGSIFDPINFADLCYQLM